MPRTPKFSTPGSVASPVVASPFPAHSAASRNQFSSPTSAKLSPFTDRRGGNSRGKNPRQRQQQQHRPQNRQIQDEQKERTGRKRRAHGKPVEQPSDAVISNGTEMSGAPNASRQEGEAHATQSHGRLPKGHTQGRNTRRKNGTHNMDAPPQTLPATDASVGVKEYLAASQKLAQREEQGGDCQQPTSRSARESARRSDTAGNKSRKGKKAVRHERYQRQPRQRHQRQQKKAAGQRAGNILPEAHPAENPMLSPEETGDGTANHSRTMTSTTSFLSSARGGTPGTRCPSVSAPSTANVTPVLRPAAASGTKTSAAPLALSGEAASIPVDPAILAVVGATAGAATPSPSKSPQKPPAGNRKFKGSPKAAPSQASASNATPANRQRKSDPGRGGIRGRGGGFAAPPALRPLSSIGSSSALADKLSEPTSSVILLDARPFSPINEESTSPPRNHKKRGGKGGGTAHADPKTMERAVLPSEMPAKTPTSTIPTFAVPKPLPPPHDFTVHAAKSEVDTSLSRRGLRVDAPAFFPKSVNSAALSGLLSPPSPGVAVSSSLVSAKSTVSPQLRDARLRFEQPQHHPRATFPPTLVEGSSSVSSSRQLSYMASPVMNSNTTAAGGPQLPLVPRPPSSAAVGRTPASLAAGSAGIQDAFPHSPATADSDSVMAENKGGPVFPGFPPGLESATGSRDLPRCESGSLSPKALPGFHPTSSSRQLSMSNSGVLAHHSPSSLLRTPSPSGGAVPPPPAGASVSLKGASAHAGTPLGDTTTSTSATRNDTDNVRHTRLTVPDNLSEDRIYHLLEAGDDDEDLNGPGVQYYEAAAAATSRARSAPSTVMVARPSIDVEGESPVASDAAVPAMVPGIALDSGIVKASTPPLAFRRQTPRWASTQQQPFDVDVGLEDDEEEVFPLQHGGRGSSVLSAAAGGFGLSSLSPALTPTMAMGAAGHALPASDDWEARSTTSVRSSHLRRAQAAEGYWHYEEANGGPGHFPSLPAYLMKDIALTPATGATPQGFPAAAAANSPNSVEWPSAPQGMDQATLEQFYQQWLYQEPNGFFDADADVDHDYEDVWEVNSSAYEQDSLDEAQALWIEEQLQANENPKGFFPF